MAREIIHYFRRNPRAADTLKGIARWRLLEQRLYDTVQDVQGALDFLVEKKFLVQVSQGSTEPVFRLNEDKATAVEEFLEGSQE